MALRATATPPTLADLQAQRDRLLRAITSGVLEIDQPILGRTTYRSMDEMDRALRYLDGLIYSLSGGAAGGTTDPAVAARRRRPIYPVVREV